MPSSDVLLYWPMQRDHWLPEALKTRFDYVLDERHVFNRDDFSSSHSYKIYDKLTPTTVARGLPLLVAQRLCATMNVEDVNYMIEIREYCNK
jgi:hypothetical protein